MRQSSVNVCRHDGMERRVRGRRWRADDCVQEFFFNFKSRDAISRQNGWREGSALNRSKTRNNRRRRCNNYSDRLLFGPDKLIIALLFLRSRHLRFESICTPLRCVVNAVVKIRPKTMFLEILAKIRSFSDSSDS